MRTTLGDILYWVGCISAVLLIGFGAYAFFTYKGGPGVAMGIACALTAVALWLIGWVLRHVVSGTWNN
jgi:hypothetical protein